MLGEGGASRAGSGSGEVTSRNAVAGSRSSCLDRAGALAEAVEHPGERAEEAGELADQVDAGEAREDDSTRPLPRPTTRAASVPGARNIFSARPSRKRVMRAGRVEEVQRVARGRGVEHDRVEAALAVQLVELGDRGELLGAGDG